MGKRYESKRREVNDARDEGNRILADQDTLANEYSLLSSIDSLLSEVDDEVITAIENVESVGAQESNRLNLEHEENDKEKNRIANEIDSELEKLRKGLDALSTADDNPFGKNSVEQAKRQYREQSEKYKQLIEDLEIKEYEIKDEESKTSANNLKEGLDDGGDETHFETNGFYSEANATNNGLEPTRSSPRDLPTTQFGFSIGPTGEQTYDSPIEMDQFLYNKQGSAYSNFQGTCGLCSIANVMRLAGVDISEKDVIDYAANTRTSNNIANIIPWANRLCTVNPLDPSASGGTGPSSRKEILEHFGISSGLFPVKMEGGIASNETIEDIANYVSDGRGVILSVHASVLEPHMYVNNLKSDFHAVTVTSVTRNKYGDVSGFYICDSNLGTSFYPAVKLQNALTGADMNVTYSHIR